MFQALALYSQLYRSVCCQLFSHPLGSCFGGTLQFPLLSKNPGRRRAKAFPCCAWKVVCGSSTRCSSCTLLGSPSFYKPWVGMWCNSSHVPAHVCSLSINSQRGPVLVPQQQGGLSSHGFSCQFRETFTCHQSVSRGQLGSDIVFYLRFAFSVFLCSPQVYSLYSFPSCEQFQSFLLLEINPVFCSWHLALFCTSLSARYYRW